MTEAPEQTQTRRSLRLHDHTQKNVLTQKSAITKSEMGSKTPGNKVKKDSTCDVCDMKFQTIQALRSHKNAKHVIDAGKRDPSPESNTKAAPKNTPTAPMSRVSKRLLLRKGKDTESEAEEEVEQKQSKILFACPKCDKTFTIYFQALKHIQKKHNVDSDGDPISSSDLADIKPLTMEECTYCNKQVTTPHSCEAMEISLHQYNNYLYCLGCDERFKSVVLFNKHASFMHRDNVDSMFFKLWEEFDMWKKMMETQVKVKYLSLSQSTTQKYYHCNYVSQKNEFDKTYLCPSLIDVKELSTGIQIHFSKEHFGHTTPVYQTPEGFIQNLTNKKEVKSENEPFEELYLKLQKLLTNVSNDACKVSYPHLQKLFNSALEMQGLLNSFDDDDDKEGPLINSSMTDDQITDVLEGKRSSARLKRKSETVVPSDAKRKKDDKSDDDNAKPKKSENAKTSKENKELETSQANSRSSPALLSPSFNDSYKQFIGDPKPMKSRNTKRKEVVKTKMGQYSPKKKEVVEIVKSKHNILKPSKTNAGFGKILKYEVREQENDCNILILKI